MRARSRAAPDDRRWIVFRGGVGKAAVAVGMVKKPSSTTASSARGWLCCGCPPWSEQPHSESESKGEVVPVEERLEGAERGLKVSSVKEWALETLDEAEGLKAVLRRRRLLVRSAEGVKVGKREVRIL